MKIKLIIVVSSVLLFTIIITFSLLTPRKIFFPRENEIKTINETDIDKKIELITAKIKLFPDNLEHMVDLGVYYFVKGPKYYDMAINILHNAWKLGSTDIRIFYYLGCMYEFLKFYELAAIEYSKFLRNVPDDIEVLIRLGNVYYKLNKLNEAYIYLEKVLKRDKNNIVALANMGFLYYQNKNYDVSKEYFLKVVKLAQKRRVTEPRNVNYYLGRIHYESKDYELAKEYFSQEQKNYPDNIENSLYLVWTFYHLREYKSAYELIIQLKELIPKNKELLSLEREIQKRLFKS
ncbi:MAG: tetratricopeptide repeat protein [Endomicrobia bacterium]|nr:tetratricopeptide repeat protein [Endomicrobiia bacterium]